MDLEEILVYCSDLSRLAGREILEVYRDPDLSRHRVLKSDSSPLTLADSRANAVIVGALRERYPEIAILSEEEQDDLRRLENPYCFIIDPLDGTKEFLKRNGQFTVNIALAHRGHSILGVIFVPVTGELYTGCLHKGSFFFDKNGVCQEMRVSDRVGIHQPEKLRLVLSASHGAPEMDKLIQDYGFTQFQKVGSSLKGCLIARGEAEIYYRHGLTSEWDTAAMQIIVEEAGGAFRQLDGSPMRYNRQNTRNEKGFFVLNSMENQL